MFGISAQLSNNVRIRHCMAGIRPSFCFCFNMVLWFKTNGGGGGRAPAFIVSLGVGAHRLRVFNLLKMSSFTLRFVCRVATGQKIIYAQGHVCGFLLP